MDISIIAKQEIPHSHTASWEGYQVYLLLMEGREVKLRYNDTKNTERIPARENRSEEVRNTEKQKCWLAKERELWLGKEGR